MPIHNTEPLVLRNVNLVDIEQEDTQPAISILIEKGRVKHTGELPETVDAREIDGSGGWVIPSFIDMHTHVTFEGRAHCLPEYRLDEDDTSCIARGAQNLFEALASGVCLVRDVGSKQGRAKLLQRLVQENVILGPELVLVGEPLCIRDGHGHEFSRAFDANDDRVAFMKSHRDEGYDWLKIMNDPENFDPQVLQELISLAHKAGLKIACHAFTPRGIKDAIVAGADTIEHALAYDEVTLSLARAMGTVFVPTYYSSWISLRSDFLGTTPAKEIDYLRQWYAFLEENIEFNIEHDIPLLVGTDGACAPSTFSDVASEIIMLNQKGMSPLKAINSATLLPAQVLGKSDDYGSIREKKWANFILLAKDPTLDIRTLESPIAVYYRGVDIVDRSNRPWY